MSFVVFDIETAAGFASFEAANEECQSAWEYTHQSKRLEGEPWESYERMAGLYPEFGQIVCISLKSSANKPAGVFSFTGAEAKEEDREWHLLKQMHDFLERKCNPATVFIGHHIMGFDVPYIVSRMVSKGLTVPKVWQIGQKKPWDLKNFHDTKKLWKLGQYTTSQAANLVGICYALGIPSPKDDISGADVNRVFHNEGAEGLARIVTYCEKDVDRTGKLYNQMLRAGLC